jgi:hypothetical protein
MARCMNAPALGVLLLVLTAGPSLAGDAIFRTPEPATMTLFGIAVGGAFITRKLFGGR